MTVNLKKIHDDSYEIVIGHGIMDQLDTISSFLKDVDRYVIVSDSMVNPLYGEMVEHRLGHTGLPTDIIEIPAGESSKVMSVVVYIVHRLMALGASRKSLLIALGGGVVGDITGFAASIYKRSIPYVQIATSLVAQVDSSVGGKTGIDLSEGKNLIGTFYQPKVVFIDLAFLETLPEKDLKNGLAEIIKYGIISDEDMFVLLEQEKENVIKREPALMEKLVTRSCEIKAGIVEKDEKEGGLRRILNFGHTVGHAIEAASKYTLSHGQAVAVGAVAAGRISHKLGFLDKQSCDRIEKVVKHYGLPTRIPADLNTENILDYMARDKKVVGTQIHFVLISNIGTPFVTPEVPQEIILQVMDELRK